MSAIDDAKTQGAGLLHDVKAFLEQVAEATANAVEGDAPAIASDVAEYGIHLIANPTAQDFARQLINRSAVLPAADAVIIKFVGQALIAVDARIAAIPG